MWRFTGILFGGRHLNADGVADSDAEHSANIPIPVWEDDDDVNPTMYKSPGKPTKERCLLWASWIKTVEHTRTTQHQEAGNAEIVSSSHQAEHRKCRVTF